MDRKTRRITPRPGGAPSATLFRRTRRTNPPFMVLSIWGLWAEMVAIVSNRKPCKTSQFLGWVAGAIFVRASAPCPVIDSRKLLVGGPRVAHRDFRGGEKRGRPSPWIRGEKSVPIREPSQIQRHSRFLNYTVRLTSRSPAHLPRPSRCIPARKRFLKRALAGILASCRVTMRFALPGHRPV